MYIKKYSGSINILADFVVFGKRKEMIQELKKGFNQYEILNVN